MAGSPVNNYTDSSGAVWSGDRYFTGGTARAVQFRAIARTKDPTIFLKYREGDFQYDIPLNPGVYEMRLLFAETNYGEGNVDGGGETSRLMNVFINGRAVMQYFDIVADAAGANTADVKVFKDVEPAADGLLHLRFQSMKAFALVNAIEILPGSAAGFDLSGWSRATAATPTRSAAFGCPIRTRSAAESSSGSKQCPAARIRGFTSRNGTETSRMRFQLRPERTRSCSISPRAGWSWPARRRRSRQSHLRRVLQS